MRTLATDRLTLEPQTAEHAEEMFAVLSDPAIYEYENQPPPSLAWLRKRFARLESRRSGNGRERWLNWVIRLPSSELIGYVQATVHDDGHAAIAYELSSAHWGRGLAQNAVAAMIRELAECYGVGRLTAVLKRDNRRSGRLLERLGFAEAPPDVRARHEVEPGETMMCRELTDGSGSVLRAAVRVRAFAEADFSELVRRWHETNLASYPYSAEHQRHTLDQAAAFFRGRLLAECEVWVAERAASLAGVMAIDPPWIRQLAVFPEQQRHGVGTALLAEARMRSPRELRLYTFRRNVPARAFYERHGFTAVGFGTSPPPESDPDVEYRWAPGPSAR
ncbi:MAG TPA: GNAT family N-acetyltransferase [Casimicrobiaceae bacterium]|nr:GNAT family N-acetyltransferase [Casimicrobiaceae bacterium]